ncbi:hypothetical protein [Streptomyces sp. NRRL S-1813]|uniref:hypothetical protein n=1 Tax=Streptomyces sp. NRRL S-1813 TaxID=1463888 RepID=UPI00056AAFAA|nr:hypothetical protein [Streptomyces sp. NRRL S-1813]
MPTAIAVTSPDLALPATDRQTPAAVVLRAPHLQPLDEALTETSAVLEHHGHLIVLYSSACPPEHIRRLHTLRSVLESDRIAIVPLSLPPLGVALLARQLRQLSLCDFSPGVLASAARLLSHYVHAGALLGSVSGLDRIEVDLRSHVKSWLPGAHFAVLAHPEPRLLHLDRHSTEAGLPAPGFTTQLALARGQLTSEWVTAALAPAWQVQGVYEARLPAESARWWGTQKLIEFAAAIPDLSVLHQLVTSVRREACGWCGLELLGDRCAFCAAPLARERAAGGGGPGQGPAAIGGPATRPGQGAAAPAATASAGALTPAPGPSGGTGAPESPSAAPAEPSPSPWGERGLSPVAPPGVAGVLGVPGVADVRGEGTDGSGETGQWDVRGPDLAAGGPPASGNPYGSGRPVPGNPYACDDGPRAPGHWHLPGHPDFAAHPDPPGHSDLPGRPDVPSHPDVPGRPDVPGTPRTVARVR